MTSRQARAGEGALPLLKAAIRVESDVVSARRRARQIAALLGFDAQHHTRLATAVSEIARNAFRYAGGGSIEFLIEGRTSPQVLAIRVVDAGPGIPRLEAILEGRYQSATGMGMGIVGARRLMDQFHIETAPGQGTTVTMRKLLPRKAPVLTAKTLTGLLAELSHREPENALDELQQQNRELIAALDELGARQEELSRLNHELEDTNRGVVALYAELDEKADHLRRADEMKSRFLSNMSHEFRTPLNSILALSRLLLDRSDGELTPDQERQVFFIRRSAESLFELVNDLLDLAKVEAGKITVHVSEFDARNLFGALRGMLRPLLLNTSVSLIFEEPNDVPILCTDEGKVSQILRNFIANALKFTEKGEVRIAARVHGENVIFSVADTGIGIAPEDLERIFQEFTQVEHPIQRTVRGTGLGLPLSRRLAELLGGQVRVQSEIGTGSIFSAEIPMIYPASVGMAAEIAAVDQSREPILIVEDHFETRLVYERYFRDTKYQVYFARSEAEARNVMHNLRPRAILLDIVLKDADTWGLLSEWKSASGSRDIPIIVITDVEDVHKGYGLGADEYAVKPVTRDWLLETLDRFIAHGGSPGVLVIDDDVVFRYLVRQLFSGAPYEVVEAGDGGEGISLAARRKPDLIFLDLAMSGMDGFETLRQLRAEPETAAIPVIVATSKILTSDERRLLTDLGAPILSKEAFSSKGVVQEVDGLLRSMDLAGLATGSEGHR